MPSAWGSVMAPAMGYLLSAWQGWPALGGAGVEVRDGPQVPDTSSIQAVFVGWSSAPAPASTAFTSTSYMTADAPENGADFTAVGEGLGGHRDRVKGTIHCCAAYLDGDADSTAARLAVEALVDACGQAVDVDRTLGGTVMWAVVSSQALRTVPDAEGALAWQLFDVEIDAYTPG